MQSRLMAIVAMYCTNSYNPTALQMLLSSWLRCPVPHASELTLLLVLRFWCTWVTWCSWISGKNSPHCYCLVVLHFNHFHRGVDLTHVRSTMHRSDSSHGSLTTSRHEMSIMLAIKTTRLFQSVVVWKTSGDWSTSGRVESWILVVALVTREVVLWSWPSFVLSSRWLSV